MTTAFTKLPVMEHFYTIQGEGYNTGKAAFFIRLAGCDVGCVWCDVKESWDSGKHTLMHLEDLLSEAKKCNAENIVVTGGEPCMYDLTKITSLLKLNGFTVWLETSGAYPIKGNFDWICLSPKKFKKPLEENLAKADELKVVVFNKSDLKWAEENAALTKKECKLFLQPEFDSFKKVMPLMIDYVKQNQQWRIGLQTHKVIDVP
ncbi:MAG TPA: 7-carboxy-7-deazaguanine synthase QueE [Bacteroidia bacterium]|nr:7-carboxy-7-deazaguanine synthase QueE [Bacteroidia bacterium]HNU34262.1 7-carboxy-7-deazaguanine synthase QueE [Bacteroidia bacterium]